jgi:hypothetical protein
LVTVKDYRSVVAPRPRDELVGQAEIAEMLGVTKQRVHQLTGNVDFPLPVQRLRSGRIWRRKDVETWARDTGRLS